MTTQSCPVDGDKISMDDLDYETVMMKQKKDLKNSFKQL